MRASTSVSTDTFDPQVFFEKYYPDVQKGLEIIRAGSAGEAKARVWLLVGLSGAGKSTALNGLLGHEMRVENPHALKLKYKLAADDVAGAVIGHAGSETSIPAIYNIEGKTVVIGDTPGLGDNRSDTIAVSNATSLAQISEVANIQGVSVVISITDFQEARGDRLCKLFALLPTLLPEFDANDIAFCVSDRGLTTENFEAKKQAILDSAAEAITMMQGLLLSDDTSEDNKKGYALAIAALKKMTMGNLFLMGGWENRVVQEKIREELFSYMNPERCAKKINFVLEKTAKNSFLQWADQVAQSAKESLDAKRQLINALQELNKKEKTFPTLLDKLQAIEMVRDISPDFAIVRARLPQLQAELHELESKRALPCEVSFAHPVLLPQAGSGVSVLYAKEVVVDNVPFFSACTALENTRILEEDREAGRIRFRVDCQLDPAEPDESALQTRGGVVVRTQYSHLDEYKSAHNRLTQEITDLKTVLVLIEEDYRKQRQFAEKCRVEIVAALKTLDITVEDLNNIEQIRAALEKAQFQNHQVLTEGMDRLNDVNNFIEQHRQHFDLVYQVTRYASYHTESRALGQFLGQYEAAFRVPEMLFRGPAVSRVRSGSAMFRVESEEDSATLRSSGMLVSLR